MNTYWPRSRWLSPRALEMEGMLLRYRRLNDGERRQLLSLYRKLTMLDLATILTDDELSRRLSQFRKDHAASLRRSWMMKVRVAAALLTAAIAAGLLLA